MGNKLKTIFANIINREQSICLDNSEDREKLINLLTKAFTPLDFNDVATISEAIFPNSQVDETMMSCELIIKTGLFNVAACGDEPVLVGSSSPEIFSQSEETTETDIFIHATGTKKDE
tara:strand:+ start:1746 stop:2099 length:354 start_codon:yes stop_codon:yes gene_type:complete